MPRSRQGGQRAGTPGQAYTNRSDLNAQRSLPVRTAPGQIYGEAAQQAQAQRQVPMAPPSLPAAPGGSQAPQMPPIAPGGFGDIHRPTERPMEPVTAGAALGPGPGVEALGPGVTGGSVSAMLQHAAQQTGSNVLMQMASRASAAGQ